MTHDSRFGSPIKMEQSSRRPSSSSAHLKTLGNQHSVSGESKSVQHILDGVQEDLIRKVLLAEFDIDQGATLSLQYPTPTGTDEHTLAELMLPDGAHLRSEDWTVFYLNQTGQCAPHGHDENSQTVRVDGASETLFVMNCVKMKEDKSVRRGAMVKALAVCTTKPYIQVFKPLLSLALDEYYQNPSPIILAKLFDSINSISMRGCPRLTQAERLILRYSERNDLFKERFPAVISGMGESDGDLATIGDERTLATEYAFAPTSKTTVDIVLPNSSTKRSIKGTLDRFSNAGVRRMRKSSRSSMRDMSDLVAGRGLSPIDPPPPQMTPGSSHSSIKSRQSTQGATVKDTHFFETTALYNGMTIPIKIPLASSPEEVSEYSVTALVQKFSPPSPVPFPQPFHPHLHTSGAFTHPIILLLNALLTEKRILFLGHGQPAGNVASFVLAACALSGHVLRGFTERAFPYSNLAGLDTLEATPGYIAGVINPRFEDLQHTWDILCNIETGRITVSKHLDRGTAITEQPYTTMSPSLAQDDSISAAGYFMGGDSRLGSQEAGAKGESHDSQFIEEILSGIASHSSETAIRARLSEYIHRFVRLASRYEEETLGCTAIGFSSKTPQDGHLGSGYTFANEATKTKELAFNAPRIEGWRRTRSYEYWKEDFHGILQIETIRDIDLHYQLSRLRYTQSMTEEEVISLFSRLEELVQDQVVEFLAYVAPFSGGLSAIAAGLFHPNSAVRKSVVQLLSHIEEFSIGASIISGLNAFQKLAYIRMKAEGQ